MMLGNCKSSGTMKRRDLVEPGWVPPEFPPRRRPSVEFWLLHALSPGNGHGPFHLLQASLSGSIVVPGSPCLGLPLSLGMAEPGGIKIL
jgi:hypothetical protein